MTPEEQMRMSMAIQRAIGAGEQPPPGMISQSAVTPEMAAMAQQDFSAAQSRLAQQQRMAEMLMGRSQDVPQGVQAGNVYVAGANPMTALAQALSGYQAGRTLKQVNEGYDDLEGRMGEAAAAKGRVAAVQDAREATTLKATLARDAALKKYRESSLQEQIDSRNAADQQENAKRSIVTFHHPVDPERTINLLSDRKGNLTTMDGEALPPGYADLLTPYHAGQAGSTAKAVMKAEAAAAEAEKEEEAKMADSLLSADQATRVLMDPLLRTATGHFADPEKYLSSWGMPGYEDAQALVTRMASVTMDAVAPTLDKMGVNPTDRDLAEAFKTAPRQETQPETWIDWYANTYRPRLVSAIRRGTKPEMADSMDAAMLRVAEQAKALHAQKKPEVPAMQVDESGWGAVRKAVPPKPEEEKAADWRFMEVR